MKSLLQIFAALACVLVDAGELETPAVQQAVKLLSNLQAQVSDEGNEAGKVFEDEKKLCSRRSRELRHSHDGVKAELEKSDAELAQASIEIDTMSTKIEEMAMSIASSENDLKEAQKLRDEEASVFSKEEQGLVSTVDALDRALAIIGHEQRKVYKSKSLLQMEDNALPLVEALSAVVEASSVSTADGQRLMALVQSSQKAVATEDAEDADVDAALGVEPSPVAYQSKSGNLLAVLNEVLEKAQGELEKLRREEQEKLHSFQLLKQSLEAKMKLLNRDMASAQELKTEASQKKAAAEGSLVRAKKSMSEAAIALQDLQGSCLKKAAKFEKDMQARSEEVKALQEAKNAIAAKMGGDVSFLQLGRSRGTRSAPDSERSAAAAAAARSVRRLAVKLESPSLVELAGRLDYAASSSHHLGSQRFGADDPFRKVRGLIEGMIGHLQSEARAEADHQAFCDKEMSVTGIKSADKQDDVDKLGTKIEQSKARLAHLTEQTATLREELTDLAQTQLEMDQVRSKEKALFDKTDRDAQDGMEGLRLALQVLRGYYARLGDPAGRGKQVVSMLEYAKSDIHRRVTVLTGEEEQAVSEYQRVSKDNAVMSATKQHEVETFSADATALQKLLNELTSDHSSAREELDALQEYMAKLQDQCVAKPEPYEERKQKREKEVQGLREALAALDGSQLQVAEAPAHTAFLQLRGSGTRVS